MTLLEMASLCICPAIVAVVILILAFVVMPGHKAHVRRAPSPRYHDDARDGSLNLAVSARRAKNREAA